MNKDKMPNEIWINEYDQWIGRGWYRSKKSAVEGFVSPHSECHRFIRAEEGKVYFDGKWLDAKELIESWRNSPDRVIRKWFQSIISNKDEQLKTEKSECAEKFQKAVKAGEYSFSQNVLERLAGGLTLSERLESQRAAFKRKENDTGRFEIISKPQMKLECGHSPDDLEALFMREVFDKNGKRIKNIGLL